MDVMYQGRGKEGNICLVIFEEGKNRTSAITNQRQRGGVKFLFKTEKTFMVC